MTHLRVNKVSDEHLAYKNCVLVHPSFLENSSNNYYTINVKDQKYLFHFEAHSSVNVGCMGLTLLQRKFMDVLIDSLCAVTSYTPPKTVYITKVFVTIDFLQKSRVTSDLIDTDKLVISFMQQFSNYPITVGQSFAFLVDSKTPPFMLTFNDIEVANILAIIDGNGTTGTKSSFGILSSATQLIFKKAENSQIVLTGKSKDMAVTASPLISPTWDFNQMGIGGLDKEFSAIFRRAFASRLFPPELVQQLGLKHVRGILLHGPPGTGKTLMARQIGKMLNSREPKIVNGPEIFNKYVGESESNVRKLFEDAEIEQKRCGINSGVHIIIFDEIDAICKQRGSTGGSTGVADTVVNQLLSKIDGVDQLNNILIIGMTNRKDLIDEALLRPGRLEVQMEISLPDENGRLQILNIHTSQLRQVNKLAKSVDLAKLANETKNFSGAELEGLVRSATTTAMNRLVKVDKTVSLDPKAMEHLTVTMDDFTYALKNDVKPSFGATTEDLSLYVINGVVHWCDAITHIITDGNLMVEQTRNGGIISPVSVLFEGYSGAGKTALASHIALTSKFPLIKVCSADQMVGFSEVAKCQYLKKIFDDAAKSELSCIVIDNIERILEYVSIGPRFSNPTLQTLLVLLNKRLPNNRKLLVIATTSCISVMEEMGVQSAFTRVISVPLITNISELERIVEYYNFFNSSEFETIKKAINNSLLISIKKLLSLCEIAIQAGKDNSPALKFIELLIEEKVLRVQ